MQIAQFIMGKEAASIIKLLLLQKRICALQEQNNSLLGV